jgi:hypothetical protein
VESTQRIHHHRAVSELGFSFGMHEREQSTCFRSGRSYTMLHISELFFGLRHLFSGLSSGYNEQKTYAHHVASNHQAHERPLGHHHAADVRVKQPTTGERSQELGPLSKKRQRETLILHLKQCQPHTEQKCICLDSVQQRGYAGVRGELGCGGVFCVVLVLIMACLTSMSIESGLSTFSIPKNDTTAVATPPANPKQPRLCVKGAEGSRS